MTVLVELRATVYSMDYDYKNKQVYLPRYFNNDIMRFGYHTGFIVVHKVVSTSNRPAGLAIDSNHNHIYWTESVGGVGRIVRCDLDGSNVTIIAHSLDYPFVLRLDVKNRFRYPAKCIKLQIVVSTRDRPAGIAIDSVQGHVYWTESIYEKGRIVRCNFDGSNVIAIFESLEFPFVIRLDIKNRWMYFVERFSRISRSSLNVTQQQVLVNVNPDVTCMDLDIKNERLYWILDNTGDLKSALVDGTSVKTIINTNCKSPVCKNIAIDVVGTNIYFSNHKQLSMSNTSTGLGFTVLYNDTNRIDSIYSISGKIITDIQCLCM
ncbi:LRP4 [Mytilus coruscus]|uniref:LRP4 n=1 Tax=Mytilus coruscus TaxID=42192 RepID=A0A6J8CPW2_MYTCO|nr:LRP4 [Mytilus coruscus]